MSWPYSITTRATGTTLTAAIYNADHQNHSDNNIPTSIKHYSTNATEMQATTDPGEVGTESLATSLDGEIARLRFAIKELKDVVHGSSMAQWYTSTASTTAAPIFSSITIGPATFTGVGTVNAIIDAATAGTAALNFGINGVRKAYIYFTSSLALLTQSTDQVVFGTNNTVYMSLGAGLLMGSPTGGDKGSGTINVATDIYKNNTAYTNPDYVLEHWATGKIEKFADKVGANSYHGLMTLEEVERFARDNFCLPGFGQLAEHGLFEGSDKLLAVVEEAYVHLFNQNQRIAALEAKLSMMV